MKLKPGHSVDDLFFPDATRGPVRITTQNPIMGEVWRDRDGLFYLSPEKDFRFTGGHALPLTGFSADQLSRYLYEVVQIAGTYEESKGIEVEAITLASEPFAG